MHSHQLDEEAIFHIARDLTNQEKRDTYLDQVCAGDQALRDRVEALLGVHEQSPEFLHSGSNDANPTVDHASMIVEHASRAGPCVSAPTCQSRARWKPRERDAASKATKRGGEHPPQVKRSEDLLWMMYSQSKF